jgi:hypothetical protein
MNSTDRFSKALLVRDDVDDTAVATMYNSQQVSSHSVISVHNENRGLAHMDMKDSPRASTLIAQTDLKTASSSAHALSPFLTPDQ